MLDIAFFLPATTNEHLMLLAHADSSYDTDEWRAMLLS